MAHHASTPQSVLDAPTLTPTVVVQHRGLTRRERRHGATFARQIACRGFTNSSHRGPVQSRGEDVYVEVDMDVSKFLAETTPPAPADPAAPRSVLARARGWAKGRSRG